MKWLDAVDANYSLRSLTGFLHACPDIDAEQIYDPLERCYRQYGEVLADQGRLPRMRRRTPGLTVFLYQSL